MQIKLNLNKNTNMMQFRVDLKYKIINQYFIHLIFYTFEHKDEKLNNNTTVIKKIKGC